MQDEKDWKMYKNYFYFISNTYEPTELTADEKKEKFSKMIKDLKNFSMDFKKGKCSEPLPFDPYEITDNEERTKKILEFIEIDFESQKKKK